MFGAARDGQQDADVDDAVLADRDRLHHTELGNGPTARAEYYEFPAALPKVKVSSLREDLYRRDFTIEDRKSVV